jgi:adenosylhomocysteine nucleosidase
MQPILIIVPTESEQTHLAAAFDEPGVPSTHGRLSTRTISALNLVIAQGGLGKTQFAVHTQHLLDVGTWSLVICAGSAGGLSDELSIGDVVVASETIEHDIKKVSRRLMPRFPTNPRLLQRFGDHDSAGFRTHVGPIASGDEDIVSESRRAHVRQETGAIAVAWEGAGGARACQFCGVDFVEIRAIADGANEHGPRDFAMYLERAMQNLATVVRRVIIPAIT